MSNSSYSSISLFEHRFWLRILGDHARFIFFALAPNENAEVQKALQFIHIFDKLLDYAHKDLTIEEISTFNQTVYKHTQQIREFKLHLLQRHLIGKISIGISSTFLSHMVNELDEYMYILNHLLTGTIPPALPAVHHHLVWLLDAVGHSQSSRTQLIWLKRTLNKRVKFFQNISNNSILKQLK